MIGFIQEMSNDTALALFIIVLLFLGPLCGEVGNQLWQMIKDAMHKTR